MGLAQRLGCLAVQIDFALKTLDFGENGLAWLRKKGPPSSKALRPAVFDKPVVITGE
jgi:hypothetical protein